MISAEPGDEDRGDLTVATFGVVDLAVPAASAASAVRVVQASGRGAAHFSGAADRAAASVAVEAAYSTHFVIRLTTPAFNITRLRP